MMPCWLEISNVDQTDTTNSKTISNVNIRSKRIANMKGVIKLRIVANIFAFFLE